MAFAAVPLSLVPGEQTGLLAMGPPGRGRRAFSPPPVKMTGKELAEPLGPGV